MKKWWQSKTIWTGLAGVCIALGGYLTDEVNGGTALQTAVFSLIGIFLRLALSNLAGQVPGAGVFPGLDAGPPDAAQGN